MKPQLVRLGDLAEQVRGVSYSKEDASDVPRPGYLPVLRAGNITDEGLHFDDLVFVPAARISTKQLVRRSDVVVAASSGSLDIVGKAAPALKDFDGGFGAFCKVLRPSQLVDSGYFAQFFKTAGYRRRVSALAAGANINNLRNEHLDDMLVPLPSLSEQRRIAAILEKADALRAKRRATLALLDSLTSAAFLEMFGDQARSSSGWDTAELKSLVVDGPQNGLYRPSSDYGRGVPILRIDGFYDGAVVDIAALKRVDIGASERDLFGLAEGDVVINRVNSIEYLGKCALIPRLAEPTVFESNMMRLRVDSSVILPRFLVQVLQTPELKSQIRSRAKRAVNQASINQQDVGSFRVPVPPLASQHEFVARVAAIQGVANAARRSAVELDSLFASLQHQAFNGEL